MGPSPQIAATTDSAGATASASSSKKPPSPPVRAGGTATSPPSIGGKGGAHFVAGARRPSKNRRPIFFNRQSPSSSPSATAKAVAKKKRNSNKKHVTITDSPPSIVAAAAAPASAATGPHPSSPPAASTGLEGDVDPSLSDITHSHVDLEDPDADLVYPLVPLPTAPISILSSKSSSSKSQQPSSYAPPPPPPPPLRVPIYGWTFREMCDREIYMYNLRKGVAETQIVVWTMWTIIAAVLYAHTYQGYPQVFGYPADGNTDVMAYVLFASTILFPIYITILMKWRQQLVSTTVVDNITLLRVTRAQLESEIYQFRVGVGPYKDEDEVNSTDNADNNKKKHIFLTRTKALWTTLTTSLVSTASKRLWDRFDVTYMFWLNDDDEKVPEEEELRVNIEVQDEKVTEQYMVEEDGDDEFDYSELPRQPQFCTTAPRDLEMAMPATPTETTPLTGEGGKNGDDTGTEQATADAKEAKEQDTTPTSQQVVVDSDPRSLLTVDAYVAIRLDTIIDKTTFRIMVWKYTEMALKQLVVLLTFITTVVALLSMQWTIPILLAVVAGITTTLEWAHFASRLQVEQTTLSTLQGLRDQFHGLLSSPNTAGPVTTNDGKDGERETARITPRLVEEVEAVIVKGVVAMTT